MLATDSALWKFRYKLSPRRYFPKREFVLNQRAIAFMDGTGALIGTKNP